MITPMGDRSGRMQLDRGPALIGVQSPLQPRMITPYPSIARVTEALTENQAWTRRTWLLMAGRWMY